MADELLNQALTAQERLAMSRHALVEQLREQRMPRRRRIALREARASGSATFDAAPAASATSGFEWLAVAQRLGLHWWRRHPLRAAGEVARPLLEQAARERPLTVVATAAAAGGLLVLTRPWRLLTLSATVAALLKTSELAGVITTLMHREPSPRKETTT